MTINQIKMLTTSCKNYKSLKQCVIEKKKRKWRREAQAGRWNLWRGLKSSTGLTLCGALNGSLEMLTEKGLDDRKWS
jgi:hypothetical protein